MHFNQIGPLRQVNVLVPFWDGRHKVSFPRTLCCAQFRNNPRVDNLAVAILRFYSLSYTAASWVKSVRTICPVLSIKLAALLLLFDALTEWHNLCTMRKQQNKPLCLMVPFIDARKCFIFLLETVFERFCQIHVLPIEKLTFNFSLNGE